MEDLGKNITKIEMDELLPVVMEKKNDEWRIGQICCVFVDGKYEVTYSFCDNYDLKHYRLIVDKDEPVPSISRIYRSAHFYENEMAELFGLNVEFMKVDLNDKLYQIKVESPFVPKEEQ